MKKKTKNSLLRAICLILFILFLFQTKSPHNFLNIIKNNYEARFAKTYDFCNVESVGYLKYVKKKYKLIKRPKIINYIHTGNLNWVMIEPKNINNYSNYIILLNYPGKSVDLRFSVKKDNTFKISRLDFYKDKIEKIKKIKIRFKEKFKFNNKISVETYSNTIKQKDKSFLKSYHNINLLKDNIIEIDLNLDFINKEYNSIIFTIKNLKKNLIDEIKFISNNKYDIDNYTIIDNYKNCYLLK